MGLTEMPTRVSVDQLLSVVKQLPPADLDRFVREFLDWRASEGRAADEAALLARISANSRLPGDQQSRFEELRRRRQVGRLTRGDEAELQALWDRAEEMSVRRLEALVDLARLRHVDLDTVMHGLHLDARRDGS